MDLAANFQLEATPMGYCLSTVPKTNGAVAIFLPGVMQRLKYLFGSDFYVVFTSIHEAMLHSAKTADPEYLKSILKDSITDFTPKDDILTYSLYYCDGNTLTRI